MNKTKKGIVNAASILTIVGCGFAILFSLLLLISSNLITEDAIKETFKDSAEYEYYENADGSHYFMTIEDGVNVKLEESEIEIMAKISSAVLGIVGFLNLGFAVAKLVLAIKILKESSKNNYSLGCVIALLVLQILSVGFLESGLLVASMFIKNKSNETEDKPKEVEIKSDFEQIMIE